MHWEKCSESYEEKILSSRNSRVKNFCIPTVKDKKERQKKKPKTKTQIYFLFLLFRRERFVSIESALRRYESSEVSQCDSIEINFFVCK